MAGRAAQIDITPLTLEELHWLMDSIVRRQQALPAAPKAPVSAGPVPGYQAAPVPAAASASHEQGKEKHPHGLRPKSAMAVPKSGVCGKAAVPGVPELSSVPATTAAPPRASVPHPATVPNESSPADLVMDTHAVFDPWSLSCTLPVRHQRPFWQGPQIYVPQPPPQRNLRLAVAKGSPPNFGMGEDGLLSAAASSALVPAQQPCSQGCLYCRAPCCIPVDEHTSILLRTFVTNTILRLHISSLGACHCFCGSAEPQFWFAELLFNVMASCLWPRLNFGLLHGWTFRESLLAENSR